MVASPGAGILLKAEGVATPFRDELLASLSGRSRIPRLVGILSTSLAPSKMYAEFTQKTCADLGFDFVLKKVGAALGDGSAEGAGVEEAIIECNEDSDIDGIMVCANLIPLCIFQLKLVSIGILPYLRRSTGSLSSTSMDYLFSSSRSHRVVVFRSCHRSKMSKAFM
jgi:hypothetical protein